MDEKISIQYNQWTQTDRSSLITVVQPVEEFLHTFIDMLQSLKYNDFIAKVQNHFCSELKSSLTDDEYLVIAKNVFKMQFNHIIGIQCLLLLIHFMLLPK